jgi:hypothetical protein
MGLPLSPIPRRRTSPHTPLGGVRLTVGHCLTKGPYDSENQCPPRFPQTAHKSGDRARTADRSNEPRLVHRLLVGRGWVERWTRGEPSDPICRADLKGPEQDDAKPTNLHPSQQPCTPGCQRDRTASTGDRCDRVFGWIIGVSLIPTIHKRWFQLSENLSETLLLFHVQVRRFPSIRPEQRWASI